MKKSITLSLASAFTALLFIGCSASNTATPSAPSSHDAKSAGSTFFSKHLTQKKVHNLVVHAGEKAGWKITEFKTNAVIAEKTDNGETTAVTISFNSNSFEINPENDDLHDAIEEAGKTISDGH